MDKSRILKFATVGVINNILNLLIVFLSHQMLGLNAFISGSLGFTGGAIVSFILNSRFTFKYKQANKVTFILFFFSQLFLLIIFSTIISLFESFLNSIIFSWIISTGIIFIFNYYIQSKLIFFKKYK